MELPLEPARSDRPRFPFRYALAASGLAALGASALLNAILYRYARRYFYESQETRLDPGGLWRYEEAVPPDEDTSRPTLLMFGDSRIEMWNPPPVTTAFRVINRGIGSQTTRQLLVRFDDHVTASRPDIVLIQAGVNDLKNIAVFPERSERIVGECIDNLVALVHRVVDLDAHVVLTTIFPHGPIELQRRPFWSARIPGAIREVNAELVSLRSPSCTVFDAWSLLGDGDRVSTPFEIDALHINPSGYAALNLALEPILLDLRRQCRSVFATL